MVNLCMRKMSEIYRKWDNKKVFMKGLISSYLKKGYNAGMWGMVSLE